MLLFLGNVTNTSALILATGVPGSTIVGPLFWLWVGYTLWTKPAGVADPVSEGKSLATSY